MNQVVKDNKNNNNSSKSLVFGLWPQTKMLPDPTSGLRTHRDISPMPASKSSNHRFLSVSFSAQRS